MALSSPEYPLLLFIEISFEFLRQYIKFRQLPISVRVNSSAQMRNSFGLYYHQTSSTVVVIILCLTFNYCVGYHYFEKSLR